MIKREMIILSILIAAVFLITGICEVNAEGYNKYSIYINDSKLEENISVQVINGFDYIPINLMQAKLNLTVKEDKAEKSISFSLKGRVIKITEGINVYIDNIQGNKLDVPVIVNNNNIYVPIIAAADIFGWHIEVLDDIRAIRIRTSFNAAPAGIILSAELSKQNGAEYGKDTKAAYLTFDDGLDPKVTPLVLNILKENDIKATFFIQGKTVEKNKDLLKRMLDEGHSIGNHTYSHEKGKIYTSAEGLKQEIDKTNTAIFNAVGVVPKLFRPPYGGTYIRKDIFRQVLSPYKTILWNVDSMDSKSIDIKSSEIINSVINQVKNKKIAVIIMHDSGTHMETVKALPAIIDYLRNNEFEILPIDEYTNIYYQY